ncbi:hypothetical protein [Photobacterium leiognathi]|uniref:hypothetical protein n=1 Tax=Photobacterium leiognathi TaxID=553611 RepID=UPI0029821B80|nr:hypothetical protein [Photobacterium leiognathi]
MHTLKQAKTLLLSTAIPLTFGLVPFTHAEPLTAEDYTKAKNLGEANTRSLHPTTSRVIKVSKHRSNVMTHNEKWMDVYRYHYPTDTTERIIYDVVNDKVVDSKQYKNIQFSATRDEIAYAKQLLTNNPAFMDKLSAEYYDRYHHSLPIQAPLSGLNIKAIVLTSDNPHSIPLVANTKNCGLNRCIYFFFTSLDAPYEYVALETKAIVNLSKHTITPFRHKSEVSDHTDHH